MTPTWEPHHGRQLKVLREAAGLEIITLARKNNLSVSQVEQLENGGDSSFYTQEIKFNSGRKLLRALGAEIGQPEAHFEMTPPLLEPVQQLLPAEKSAVRRFKWHWHKMDLIVLVMLMLALLHFTFQPQMSDRPSPRTQRTAHASEASRVASAPSAAPVLPAVISLEGPSCPAKGKEVVATSTQASKPGNYVHVVAQAFAVVCVTDASQKSSVLSLKPGAAQSVYGQAPFRISSAELRAVRLFYQGHPVAMPNEHFVNLVLNEKK